MYDVPNPTSAFESTGDSALASMSAGPRERLMELAHRIEYQPGTEIFREGADTAFLGFVEAGRVALRLRIPERGERLTFATIEPGELLGWSALVAPYRATAEAVATERARVLALDATELRGLMARDREVAAELMPLVLDAVARRLTTSWHQLLDTFSTRTYGPW
jgi:CRP/FNR family transcriptional regulator, cyclic AMP receptor protein